MTPDEAIKVCEGWFRHLERQRERAVAMARAAKLASQGPEGYVEAQKIKRRLDQSPRVYDGARLAEAVKTLITTIEKIEELALGGAVQSSRAEHTRALIEIMKLLSPKVGDRSDPT